MTDQPKTPREPHEAAQPQPPQPAPPPPRFDPPPPPQPAPPPQQFTSPQPPQPAPPPQQFTNPYGGYAAAPPPTAYGQPLAGTLPYVETYFGPVATFGPRALAYLVDAALVLIGLIPMIIGVVMMTAGVAASTTYNSDTGSYEAAGMGASGAVGVLLMIVGVLLMIAITIWNRIFRMGRTGQSIGKKVVGLKLINATTGQPIGPLWAFLREIVHGLANQIVYLSFLWMLWDPNRQTLGDLVAKSSVIVVPKR